MFDYQPPDIQPSTIYIDADLLVIDKPAELLSVPGRRPEHQDCLLFRIQQTIPEALIVHRLDMSTSGLMVLARNSLSQRHISQQFEQRQVEKRYMAKVAGKVSPASSQVDLPLICDWPNRPKQIVDHEQGKRAITCYQVLSYDPVNDVTQIALKPITGRTHQLRVHMQALGHPILGDDLYADQATFSKADRLLLHAIELIFNHPTSGQRMIFTLPPPF